jgi:LuxR family transcriptional regulator, maltose regulon positive regulatory protein
MYRDGASGMRAQHSHLLDVLKTYGVWMVAGFLLGATTCGALDDPDQVRRAVDRAIDLAESDAALLPAVIQAASRRPRDHAPAVTYVSDPGPRRIRAGEAQQAERARPYEPLTDGESRVLRYLPSHLSAQEIANELRLSTNTIKTHQRHVYRKLDARNRSEAVRRARALGLLAPLAPR